MSCESWAIHDWHSDTNRIERRRANAKCHPELERTFAKFSSALSKASFRDTKKMLGLAFLSELGFEQRSEMTNREGIEAVERAIDWFGQYLKYKDHAYSRYGAIEYAGIPRQLPRREVAIALSLADRITFLRRDGLSEGTLCCPHKPSLSKNLPWKAIALFASANCANRDSELTTSNVQTLVTSLARKVVLVHWSSDKLRNTESTIEENAVA